MLRLLFTLATLICLILLQTFTHAKNNFVVKQERAVVIDTDPEIVTCYINVYMFNRTNKALNLTLELHQELDKATRVKVFFLKYTSNEYRHTAIQFTDTLIKLLQYTIFDLQKLFLEYSKPPLVWPLKTNVPYRIEGFDFDPDLFPPFFPTGKYKVIIQFDIKKHLLLHFDWYLNIEPTYN